MQGRGIENRKGYISIFDLYEYVFGAVKSEVQRWFGMLDWVQEPELTVQKGVGAMAVALHRGQQPTAELDDADYPESLGGAVRKVGTEESQQALQQVLMGKVNIAAGGNVENVKVIEQGDDIDARGVQNFFNRSTGPVSIQYGDRKDIHTGGGDFAGGNIYKTDSPGFTQEDSVSLHSICQEVMRQIEKTEIAGLDDLADDLRSVELDLKAAMKAEARGKSDRRQEKITSAMQRLEQNSHAYPKLKKQLFRLKDID